ncbi:MAG: amidohydrolase [Clostridia bacterium]|nr:amidohydrolase [Clostridia bacterium]
MVKTENKNILKQLLLECKGIEEEIIKHRRALHQMAEVGFELERTYSYVFSALEEIGLTPKRCGKCGIECSIWGDKADKNAKCILLRADMDALPIKEETSLEFKSDSKYMHACGHDMHTAMLLGCAKILYNHRDKLHNNIKLAFQPAEESLMGAKDMIENGVLENPRVDYAFMLHVLTGENIDTGTIIMSKSEVSAPYATMLEIKLEGKGAHGAMPEKGVNPIYPISKIALAIKELNDSARDITVTLGQINAGETANVVPEIAICKGSLRAMNAERATWAEEQVKSIALRISKEEKVQGSVDFYSSCPCLLNDKGLAKNAQKALCQSLGERRVTLLDSGGGGGSEDFAYISHRVPSLMLAIGAGKKDDGYIYPLHNPKAMFDEKALAYGACAYATLAFM